ncbi:hypothetical protein [Sphingosinicella sp. LY1275]|uniref:hypothetical protein n=1 Tax=Sphingosinicella sp. LY1275 TaxID=3095379 RepID=UPI002ADED80B|nr:hypothetical protein [Sphingosinicella sp. LY1275]MEA1014768.1 hypothetical protein [Sphingosinicella sp. LY1275]
MTEALPRVLLIGASLLAAACSPSAPEPAPQAAAAVTHIAEPRQDLPEEQRSPDLFGAWLVEAVEAPKPVARDRSWDMVMLVGVRQLELLSQCVTIGPFDYGRTPGGGIAVRQPVAPPRAGRSPPPVQCARALSPAEAAMPAVLLGATDVQRQADGMVLVAGPRGSALLRRPEGALRNPRGQAPPPRVPPLLGAWRFVSVDGRALPPGEEMELLLRPSRLEWRSGCVSAVRALRRDGDTLRAGESDMFPVCERGRSEAERSAERLFAGSVTPRMAADGRLRLEGSGVTAELVPLATVLGP